MRIKKDEGRTPVGNDTAVVLHRMAFTARDRTLQCRTTVYRFYGERSRQSLAQTLVKRRNGYRYSREEKNTEHTQCCVYYCTVYRTGCAASGCEQGYR